MLILYLYYICLFLYILSCRNSHLLEKQVFHGKSSDYLFFLLSSMILLLLIAPLTNVIYFSNALNYVMTYFWGRKSPNNFVNFMNLFIMRAPYLPWFYLILSFLLESDIKADLMGIFVGHVIFYFKEIFPRLKISKGKRPLETPSWLVILVENLGLNNDFIQNEDEGDVVL